MNLILLLEQTLNGLQLGVMLFLMAAGLTLVFGIMNLVNLAHGSLYMVGAYLATAFFQWTGSFLLAVPLALAGTLLVGMVVEIVALRTLYERDHLDQVLATFGLILFFNELIAILCSLAPIYSPLRRRARVAPRARRALPRPALPVVPVRHHPRRPRGRGAAVVRRHAHAARHADSRRRVESHHGGGARRQHPPPVHGRVRLRRRARRPRRAHGRSHLRGAARHGRGDPHPGVRGHRHRRHRLDPRRGRRRGHRGGGGHAGGRPPSAHPPPPALPLLPPHP